MNKILVPFILFFSTIAVDAQTVSVEDSQKISRQAGEAQSTVVPPGANTACINGRFLVTTDRPGLLSSPGSKGVVVGRDLNNPAGTDIEATFDPVAGRGLFSEYMFGTNDHDLLTLNNGDVLFLTGAFSRRDVKNKLIKNPAWFAKSFRGTFGPGARTVLLTWRSTDCGQTFKYAGEFDPARMEDGSCAFPQFLLDSNGQKVPGNYDLGGSDGQLVKVDLSNNRLYLNFQCVGYLPDTSVKGDYVLSDTPLNRTLIASSDDEGAHWKSLGFVNYPDPAARRIFNWRGGIVPLGQDELALAFGFADSLTFGKRNPVSGKYDFDGVFKSPTPATINFGWDGFPFVMGGQNQFIYSFIWGHTISTHTPASDGLFFVYPDTIAGKGHGYRLWFYDHQTREFAEAPDPILPVQSSMNNFTFHLVAADPGDGPILLYWYDINGTNKTVTIRGRFITGKVAYTKDFDISKSGGATSVFTLSQSGPPGYWYGDYNTAAGYKAGSTVKIPGAMSTNVYEYYPVWMQPDGSINFAKVTFAATSKVPNIALTRVPKFRWIPEATSLPQTRLRTSVREVEKVTQHNRAPVRRVLPVRTRP